METVDKAISDLEAAEQLQPQDLLVVEQDGQPKKMPGKVLMNFLLKNIDGHGGIMDVEPIKTVGRERTYALIMADGQQIQFTVWDGEEGPPGSSDRLWVKWSSTNPDEDLNAVLSDMPDKWVGIYTGGSKTAPVKTTSYKWFKWEGPQGEVGLTPNLRIGTVRSVEFDEPPSATLSGTPENPVINLVIPRGRPGANGKNSADWNVIHPEDAGYIHNKTHYVKSGEIPLAYVETQLDGSGVSTFTTSLVSEGTLNYKTLYRVSFDGKDYECMSRDLYGARLTHVVAIGNCSLVDSHCDNTGEPFLIELFTADPGAGRITCPGYANKTVEAGIYKAEDVQKLDNKYLDALWTASKHYKGIDGTMMNSRVLRFTGSTLIHNGFPNYWLERGGKYEVYWNRNLYDCVCFIDNDGALYLGNGSLANVNGGEDVPFCFFSLGGTSAIVYKDTDTAEDVAVTIYGKRETQMEKLPPEFLPDALYLTSPNGTKYKLTVDNSGNLTTAKV